MHFKRIFDYMFYWADTLPMQTALIYNGIKITYRELRDNSLYFASALLEMGIRGGDTIAYMLDGCPEFFFMYFACSMLGVSLSGFHAKSPELEIVGQISVISPKIFIHDKSPTLRIPNEIVKTLPISQVDYSPKDTSNVEKIAATISEESVVFVVFTSGTTGMPKGALLTHRSILTAGLAQVREFRAPYGLSPEDIIQHHVPINHVSGAVQWGIIPLLSGSTLIIHKSFNPQSVLSNTEKYGATILTGVPAMWNMYFRLPNFKSFKLTSVRWCAIGAAPSNESVIKKILDICDICSNPLGMTETSGFCSGFGGKASLIDIAHTVGKIIPELSYKIVDDSFNAVVSGSIGQLAYKGDSVIKKYINADLPVTPDGYFLSGDMAFEDTNKKVHLCGRKDDMFNIGGYNVYPAEIEKVILSYPFVNKAAVLPIPHSTMGNVCRAYVVPEAQHEINVNQLRDYAANNLISYKVPRDIRICPSLPVTPLGKINKALLIKKISDEYAK